MRMQTPTKVSTSITRATTKSSAVVVLNMVVGCVVMPLLAKVKSLGDGLATYVRCLTPRDAPEPLDSSVSHVVGKNVSVRC
jgi:hypothetical protein